MLKLVGSEGLRKKPQGVLFIHFFTWEENRMKKLAVVLAMMIAFTGLATVVVALDNGPETIAIEAAKEKMAVVSFEHKKHQERAGDCITCHHTSEGDAQPTACSSCHGKDEAAPSFKDAMHKKCQPCHKEQNAAGKAAPTKCMECHKK